LVRSAPCDGNAHGVRRLRIRSGRRIERSPI
jgi:hypothetical protein